MNYKHGMKGTKLYSVWQSMKARCDNPKHFDYRHYGARGIAVCKAWRNPESFFEWAFENGYEEGLTLDRIDNDKGYSPDNCRWTTRKEQTRNRRNSRIITFNGETHCLAEWAEVTGLNIGALKGRLRAGWKPELMLTVPVSRNNSRRGYKHMKTMNII